MLKGKKIIILLNISIFLWIEENKRAVMKEIIKNAQQQHKNQEEGLENYFYNVNLTAKVSKKTQRNVQILGDRSQIFRNFLIRQRL